jgi:polyisoprenoid-binding protein YceI
MESDEFPKATFKGEIENIADIDFSKKGTYTANITGKLTIHGVTKEIKTTATFKVNGDEVLGESKIRVNPEDYGIEIPGVVREKIAKELEVSLKMNFKVKK